MLTNPWKRYRLRRGYIRHVEELYSTKSTDDDEMLNRHGKPFEALSKRRGLSKTDTQEGSSHEDDDSHSGRRHGVLKLILCWNTKKDLDSYDDVPSMDSSLSSVPTKDPRPWSVNTASTSTSPPAQLSLLGKDREEQEDSCDSPEIKQDGPEEDMSPYRLSIQSWHDGFMTTVGNPTPLPSPDTPASGPEDLIAEVPRPETQLDEGMIPPSPLHTENGMDDDSIRFESFENSDDESWMDEGASKRNESASAISRDQSNPFVVRNSTSPSRFRLKGSGASCDGLSFGSMDASFWDPDEGSAATPRDLLNSVATTRITSNLTAHVGFLFDNFEGSREFPTDG